MPKFSRTQATVAGFLLIVAIMACITSYSVTLYRLFCQVTGANGTTQRVATGSTVQTDRTVTVFFDTSVAPNLPWRFTPVQRSVKLHLGQDSLAYFEAENLSDHDIVGHATFNVTPEKAGLYFKKIQCFCFNEEKLKAGERVQMPVTFFVDPALAEDPNTEDVHEITLSYTFFQSRRPDEAVALSRLNAPDPRLGATLFAAQCAGCHALDRTKIGPALGGVAGRLAGSFPGYPYSPALQSAGFSWTPALVERWLADPQALVPGARMNMRVDDPSSRRDIAAYLAAAPAPRS